MTTIKTVLDFGYEPADLFEAKTTVSGRHGPLTLDAGEAVYVLNTPADPIPDTLMEEIRNEVSSALKLRELIIHKPSRLSEPRITQHQAGGGQNYVIQPPVLDLTSMIPNVRADFLSTDAAGNVVHDTKAERVKAETTLFSAVFPKFWNPTLAMMVNSYNSAIRDPAKELAHLYDIVEAVAQFYGDDRDAACRGLGFGSKAWDVITKFANDPQIRQGRHTGKEIHNKRDVTTTELQQARQMAKLIIERFAANLP